MKTSFWSNWQLPKNLQQKREKEKKNAVLVRFAVVDIDGVCESELLTCGTVLPHTVLRSFYFFRD